LRGNGWCKLSDVNARGMNLWIDSERIVAGDYQRSTSAEELGAA
jgi:hypothetical protein